MITLAHSTIVERWKHSLPSLSRTVRHAVVGLIKFLIANLLAMAALPVPFLLANPSVPSAISITVALACLGLVLLFCAACAGQKR